MGRALLVLDTADDKKLALKWIDKAPIGTRVEFKASKRSLPQNDLMWALLTEVAQQLEHGGRKYDPTQWKSIFLSAFGREITFLPSLDLKTFLPIELSSSDLGKDEMTDFIEFILKEGTERGVIFHTPRNSNPGPETSPAAGEDEAGYANTPSSTEPDDQPSSPAADPGTTEAPASDMSPGVGAGLPSQSQLPDQPHADTGKEPAVPVPSAAAGSVSLLPEEPILSSDDRKQLIECCFKLMDIRNADLDGDGKLRALTAAKDGWKATLPARLHPKLSSIFYSAQGVIKGAADFNKAINEYAHFLECAPEELGG